VRVAGGPNFRHVTINGTGAILRDVKVRQALAMAIDRAAIAKAMLTPLGIDTQRLNNHIFMVNQAGYQDNSGDVGKYDPDRARQLLDEAGWKLEGGGRKKCYECEEETYAHERIPLFNGLYRDRREKP